MLARELGEGRDWAELESVMRRYAEEEISQLKVNVQEAQADNRKLEQHIQEWKSIAEKSQSSILRCYVGLDKISTVLEELKSDLSLDAPGPELQEYSHSLFKGTFDPLLSIDAMSVSPDFHG